MNEKYIKKSKRYQIKPENRPDFGMVKQFAIAERLGITKEMLNAILNGRETTNKPTAFYITYINGGKENDILKYFEEVKK